MAETTTARVPAWKRLGLKLKFASDKPAVETTPIKPSTTTATPPSQPPVNVAVQSNTQKRTREERSAPEAPAKRAKSQPYERPVPSRPIVAPEPYVPKRYGFAGISVQPAGKKIVFGDEETAPITAAPISTEEPDEQATKKIRPSTLRKSVSFTPDTKAKDGETGQKYFKAWASGQDPTAIDPSAEEEPESPSRSPVEETAKPVKAPKPKKAKKPKKSKSTSLDTKSSKSAVAEDTAETEPVETPAYVAYLQQYHSDKDNWKFNKKKQNDLLKNLFNIRRLPEKYEPAIIAYVSGLQGVARERLAAQAEEVLKGIYEKESGDSAEDMSLSSSDARKAAYYGAMLRQIQNCEERGGGRDEHSDEQLRELREEVLGAKRAQTMIEHALKMELHPEQFRVVPSSVTTTTTTPTPEHPNRVEKSKRRKRKTRTTGSTSSDDSSSSSDDSSSSESDSDGDVEESEKKSASVMPPRKPIFGKELLDQAFPNTKAKQQAEESSSSDDSSDSDSDSSGA